MAYVYRHIRLDKNEPFYIGIGSDNKNYKRSKETSCRTKYWKNIVSKSGYKIEIMLDDISYEEAKEKEKEFIKLYGRIDIGTGILCNMTNGGDGCCGMVLTKSQRDKLSKAHKGKKISEETRLKMSQNKRGENHHMFGKKGELNPMFGKKLSLEHRHKMSISRLRGKCYNAKKVINTKTGIIYECAKTASEEINMNYRTLLAMLRGIRRNKTNLKYI